MTRAEKTAEIAALKDKFEGSNFFYVADSSSMTVEQINELRRICFNKGIEMKVVKNTLAVKALQGVSEDRGFDNILEVFKGPSTVMFSETAKAPAQVIKEFRKEKDSERPVLKGAYVDSDVFIGNDKLNDLVSLKTKEEVIADIIALLGSPIQSVIGALDSGSQTIFALLDGISEKAEG